MDTVVVVSSLLAFLLYMNTLPAEFAYDDSRAILKNPDLLPETPITNIFYDDFWGTPLTHSGSHKSYRPVCVLTFRLNYALGGLNPIGYHLGNVALHSVVTGLFAYTASQLVRHPVPRAVSALVFAAHPIHTESVAGVVGRADILACLFFLLAFLCYMRYCKYRDKPSWKEPDRWLPLGGMALCTALAMLSKEQGVTVLAVCAVYDVFIQTRLSLSNLAKLFKGECRGLVEGLFSLAAVGVVLVAFRISFMGNTPPEFAPADNPASDSDSLMTRALTFLYLPVLNFWLLLYPRKLSFDWSMDAVPLVETPGDPRNVLTLLFYVMLVYVGALVLRHVHFSSPRPPPNKNHAKTTQNGNGVSHHHVTGQTSFVYQTKAASAATSSAALRQRRNGRRGSNSSSNSDDDTKCRNNKSDNSNCLQNIHILIVGLALTVFPFIPATNLFFYVGFVIAERVLYIPSLGFCLLVGQGAYLVHKKCSNDASRRRLLLLVLGCLLLAYSSRTIVRNRDWLTEENLYRSGIDVNPAKAWGNLGSILNTQGKTAEAEEAYRSALQHRGNMADVHYNLGILLQEQKRYSEAIESYKMAIQCRPKLTMAYLNLGIVYGLTSKKAEAEEMYIKCTEIDIAGLKDPRLHENTKISALYNLGHLYADQGRFHDAIKTYHEAIDRRPTHYAPQSLFNMLGEAYSKLDQLDEAEHWYKEALKVKSDHIPAHLTMAKLMHKKGMSSTAEQWFKKALSHDAQQGSVHQHYGQYLGEVGRHEEAASHYQEAAKFLPNDFELLFNTANALRQAGRNIEAEDYYKRAAKVKPDVATAHMNLGAMLHFNGKLAEAEQSYMTALRLKPDDSVTQNNLKKLRSLMQQKANKGET